MTCRRAFDLDLAAFLVAPKDAEWAEFRAHYPTCPECAAEVAAWTTLATQLQADHPSPEVLLRWADDPGSLPQPEKAAIREHVARCRTCADELRALGRFEETWAAAAGDFSPAAALDRGASTSRSASDAARSTRRARTSRDTAAAREGDAARRPSRRWSRVLWNPALPYAALLALLLVPAVRGRLEPGGRATLDDSITAAPKPAATQPAPLQPELLGASTRGDTARESDDTVAQGQKRQPQSGAGGEIRTTARRQRQAAPPPPVPPVQLAERPREGVPAIAGSASREPPAAASRSARALSDMAEDEEAADEAAVSTLSEPTLKGTRRLVVPLPERSRRASAVEVRVRDVFRERELREKVPIPANASEVGLDLPAAWLGTGSYEIDLYSDDSRLLSRTTLTAR